MHTTTPAAPGGGRPHRPPLAAILAVPLVVALVLALFAWPAAEVGPRDVPVAVAGPAPAATAIERTLATQEGAFDVHRLADEAAARGAIADRDVYGAFVATSDGPLVLTASAASPAVAQLITHAAGEAGAAVRVVDVVPAGRSSTALATSVLPLVIAGILSGLAATAIATGAARRVGLLLAGSALTGLVATAIVQGWLDVVHGAWLANAGGLSLTIFAIGAAVAGLFAVLGRAGIALAAATMVFVGNPFSGAATGPEMLPAPAGGLGQLLPPGAGANLLRSTGFFDGAAAGGHVAVLAVWALAGLAALGIAAARRPRAVTATAPAAA